MNKVVLVVGIAVGLGLAACHRTPKDLDGKVVQVVGSYARTCRGVTNDPSGTISAQCKDAQGQFHPTSINVGACNTDIANINGVLTCSH